LALGVFPDTSAVAKLYHGEIGSEFTERIVAESAGACFISRLAVVEMHSVLALKERTGAILAGESEPICRRFRGDVKRRRFRVVALRARHFEVAKHCLLPMVPFTAFVRWILSNWLLRWIYTGTNWSIRWLQPIACFAGWRPSKVSWRLIRRLDL
jgi:hypothetical protein